MATAQLKTGVASVKLAPSNLRTLPIVERELRENDELAKQLNERIAENKRLLAEAEERMGMAGQPLEDVHRYASLKSACEISLAADEPVMTTLYWKSEALRSEHTGITRQIKSILVQYTQLEIHPERRAYNRRIEDAQKFIAEMEFQRKSYFDDRMAELEAAALALAGE
jgi:hypothetical protein